MAARSQQADRLVTMVKLTVIKVHTLMEIGFGQGKSIRGLISFMRPSIPITCFPYLSLTCYFGEYDEYV